MPTSTVLFTEFVEYFLNGDADASKKYEEFKEDDCIRILYKPSTVEEKSPVMCNILWLPEESLGDWNKMRYNGSSAFAMWWCSQEDEEEDEPHICKTCGEEMSDDRFNEGKMCCDKPMFHNDEDSD